MSMEEERRKNTPDRPESSVSEKEIIEKIKTTQIREVSGGQQEQCTEAKLYQDGGIVVNTEAVTKTNGIERADGVHEEVFLRVYDLSNGMAKAMSKQLFGFQIDGVWHTAIEVYGNEYYFQSGLACMAAGTTSYGPIVERIPLGFTNCTKASLDEYFDASRHLWTPAAYDLFENNCNNFSNYLADFLVQKSIPAYILELPARFKNFPFLKQLFTGQNNGRNNGTGKF